MNNSFDNLGEEGLIEHLDDLVDRSSTSRKHSSPFLDFSSRLIGIRPKADPSFESSLEQTLLGRHPANTMKTAANPVFTRLRDWVGAAIHATWATRPLKRLAFGGVPALAIVLALIIAIGNPRVDIARAVEILESDPQISAVIEAYGLRVRHVKMWKNLGYVLLDRDPYFEDVEVAIVVDLEKKTVWKIVAQDKQILSKSEITRYLEDKEAHWAKKKKQLAVEADRRGMSFMDYIAHLKREHAMDVEAKASAKGMTVEEYEDDLEDEKAAKAEAYLAEFTAKAESMGMTVEEYKAYLVEEKAGETEPDLTDDLTDGEGVSQEDH